MSDDMKNATHLEANDLLSLVRFGKLQAELRVIEMSAKPLAAKAQAIAAALNAKYGIEQGDAIDDETGEIKRAPKPAVLKAVGE